MTLDQSVKQYNLIERLKYIKKKKFEKICNV